MSETLPQPVEELDPKVRREMARRVLARRSLIAFTQRFLPQYVPGWVHQDMARRLEQFMFDVEMQRSPRLMLLMPPRHGKSEIGSVRFPGWALGHHPEWEFINCGYNLDLPMKFSRKVREMIRDPAFRSLFEDCVIDKESQSAEAWNTTAGRGLHRGGRRAVVLLVRGRTSSGLTTRSRTRWRRTVLSPATRSGTGTGRRPTAGWPPAAGCCLFSA
jgi:hypothetical protein